VFGNYRSFGAPVSDPAPGISPQQLAGSETGAPLQQSIDFAVARAFLHRFLARMFEDPEPEGWAWLTSVEVATSLEAAWAALAAESRSPAAGDLLRDLSLAGFDDFAAAHLVCFGHTVRGDCPMNEIEYGDIKADPLFQPHRLADLGAFFAAFGLELAPDAAERIDHISIELEFMSVLAAKEAHALEHQLEDGPLTTLRDAQKKFLREHLGRWTPAFARRLARMAEGTALGALACFLGDFIKLECTRFNVPAGSEDLLLRPVDDATERLCDSCGIHNLPPGAATSGANI
jgi:DMSO reductase family type II enzyme chaperone